MTVTPVVQQSHTFGGRTGLTALEVAEPMLA
jgi:hypothetical protein